MERRPSPARPAPADPNPDPSAAVVDAVRGERRGAKYGAPR